MERRTHGPKADQRCRHDSCQRQKRHRDKLETLRNAVPAPFPVVAFFTSHPDAVPTGIRVRVSREMARDIAVALRRRS